MKPDIVAPMDYTSYATPIVSSVAADLYQTANNNSAYTDVRHNSEVMKAILMAGATKLPGWSRTTTSPLDPVYGAGQVNLYNSYHILTGGEHAASATTYELPTTIADGWNFNTLTSSGNTQMYYMTVPAGCAVRNFSTVLNWNWNSALPNLDLQLYNASNLTLGSQIDASQSTVDNVEDIYRGRTDSNQPATLNELKPGQYALKVTADFSGTGLTHEDYGLAWGGSLVVEDSSLVTQPGDFNLDGRTDGTDFLIWQRGYYKNNGTSGLLQGDCTGDGIVDGSDFLMWQRWYNRTKTGPGPAIAEISPAPEPASFLLLLGAAAMLRRGRRSRI